MDTLFLDIETVPAQRPDILAHLEESMRDELTLALESVKAPSNYKDEAKITEYIVERRVSLKAEFDAKLADKVKATGLDGAFGQVLCIGWAWNDGEVRVDVTAGLDGSNEAAVLRSFFADMPKQYQKVRVVGHNVVTFDLRFIKQRAMVLGVRPPAVIPFDAKPWDDVVFDTMVQFAGVGGKISLDRLALAFGIPGKGDISGADVWPLVQAGRVQEVADYCKRDVELTRAVYRRMTFAESAVKLAA